MGLDFLKASNFPYQCTKIVTKGPLRLLQNRNYLEQILLKSSEFVSLVSIFS